MMIPKDMSCGCSADHSLELKTYQNWLLTSSFEVGKHREKESTGDKFIGILDLFFLRRPVHGRINLENKLS